MSSLGVNPDPYGFQKILEVYPNTYNALTAKYNSLSSHFKETPSTLCAQRIKWQHQANTLSTSAAPTTEKTEKEVRTTYQQFLKTSQDLLTFLAELKEGIQLLRNRPVPALGGCRIDSAQLISWKIDLNKKSQELSEYNTTIQHYLPLAHKEATRVISWLTVKCEPWSFLAPWSFASSDPCNLNKPPQEAEAVSPQSNPLPETTSSTEEKTQEQSAPCNLNKPLQEAEAVSPQNNSLPETTPSTERKTQEQPAKKTTTTSHPTPQKHKTKTHKPSTEEAKAT